MGLGHVCETYQKRLKAVPEEPARLLPAKPWKEEIGSPKPEWGQRAGGLCQAGGQSSRAASLRQVPQLP